MPIGANVVDRKWVYWKKDAILEKEGEKYKAWLMAKEYSQRERVDYNEFFSLVVKHIPFE